MTEVEAKKPQESLQDRLAQVIELLHRHKLVEDLTHRQEGQHQQLVENLVHRQNLAELQRKLDELVSFVFRECTFPNGCLIMTGTGIVPSNDFTLKSGDEIRITIDGIGTLVNAVV